MKKKYYIAYGSNMDIEQMALRCPDAILIDTSEVHGYELLFKGSLTGAYATIEANEGSIVPVLIWEISKADEANLDRYEGYPTFYYKKELEVEVEGEKLQAMVYIMDEKRQLGHPSNRYYRILKLAYERFGFDLSILKSALKKSILKGGQSIEFWS
ncbi:gamma-glutamylcyclotransferase family protein [Clostridium tyrobutyricum]|uniref:gamma-glutamylcyclotransferase family protein n=1 Tax=Clostridium tyrobutyricum TaxID=1519 RepID=UPI001C38D73F|nr:gamma-glutamylcyclotransferase family protein [Clostridium tyrobutyricum]MBV4424302.1 gamma-glutamylcyclotransferase [Clostridium tyrobutyricum]